MTEMRLYDIRVTVERIEGRSVCGLAVGDYFEVTESSRLRIPAGKHSVRPFVGYGIQRFSQESKTKGIKSPTPNTDYRFVRMGLGADFMMSDKLGFGMDAVADVDEAAMGGCQSRSCREFCFRYGRVFGRQSVARIPPPAACLKRKRPAAPVGPQFALGVRMSVRASPRRLKAKKKKATIPAGKSSSQG